MKVSNKSILVVDTPETCLDCPLLNGADECIVQDDDANFNAGDSWDELIKGCPLKEIPGEEHNEYCLDEYYDGYVDGWNSFRDRILGENKNV